MGRPSGRKRAAVLGFLGFAAAPETTAAGRDEQGAASWQRSQQLQAASAVDRRASEFIDRVHRGMLLAGARGAAAPRPHC